MIRCYIVILILALGILISSPCYGGDTRDIYAVEGRISAIDTFRSTIIVKSLVVYPVIKHSEATFFIGPDTEIKRSGSAMSIFDLCMGSTVNIRCVRKDADWEALQITIIK